METKSGNGNKADFEQFLTDLKTVVRDGEELLRAGVSTLRERAIGGARTTDRAVREHPYQTVGMIFALGIVVGLLAGGLLRSESAIDLEDDAS
jgi:ElaB/YqjD/DUF883 family membrane-anchored ribosome-binding protein